jgi:hypothetical protein
VILCAAISPCQKELAHVNGELAAAAHSLAVHGMDGADGKALAAADAAAFGSHGHHHHGANAEAALISAAEHATHPQQFFGNDKAVHAAQAFVDKEFAGTPAGQNFGQSKFAASSPAGKAFANANRAVSAKDMRVAQNALSNAVASHLKGGKKTTAAVAQVWHLSEMSSTFNSQSFGTVLGFPRMHAKTC